MKNLTERMQIRHALENKLGFGAVSKFARDQKVGKSYISQVVSGEKKPERLLKALANLLDCGVYGVFPEDKTK